MKTLPVRPASPTRWVSAFVSAFVLAVAAACSDAPTGPASLILRVTGVTPATGTSFGGTPFTITGAGFGQSAIVTVGGAPATSVVVVNRTTITAVTPQHAAGGNEVSVKIGARTAALPAGFTFVRPTIGPNFAPVVGNIRAGGTRVNQPLNMADLNEVIQINATVTDAETPVTGLTFAWTATIGTISGSGPNVTWRAPASAATPVMATLTMTVTETYIEADSLGLPVQRQHQVSGNVSVRVHNSAKEISDMAIDFLTLFSISSVPASEVMKDFVSTCDGYGAELADVQRNRCVFDITDYSVPQSTVPSIRFGGLCTNPHANPPGSSFRGADACTEIPVRWVSKVKSTALTCDNPPLPPYISGYIDIAQGVDFVTAVYRNQRWNLCHSDYQNNTGSFSTFKK